MTQPAERATAGKIAAAIDVTRCVLNALAFGVISIARFSGSLMYWWLDPGAHAPRFMLSPAPQAEPVAIAPGSDSISEIIDSKPRRAVSCGQIRRTVIK